MPISNGSFASLSPAARVLSSEDLMETVVSIIAEVTRYPRDILQADSNFEDLGIDSVKRAEILAVLTERLQLPRPEPKEGDAPPEPPRTIGDVVSAVQAFMQHGSAGSPVPAVMAPAPANGAVSPDPGRAAPMVAARREATASPFEQRVVEMIAEITRYPKNLLVAEADLAEDLGFEADTLGIIYTELKTRLKLSLGDGAPFLAARTMGDIFAAVHGFMPEGSPQETEAAPAPRPAQSPARVASFALGKPFLDKVALVTGSGRGLGKAIAAHLAKLGATVVVNSFHSRQHGEDATAEILASGGKAAHLWGSVTNPAHLEQIFKEIDSRFGGVDFLVSNASNGILAPMKDITPEHWDRAFRTNVVGLHQSALLAAASMRRRGGGKIVALSSVGAQRCMDYLGCIGTVKAAVESLVRYLAVELGSDNIQVNALSSGPVYGELMEKYPDLEKLRPLCEAQTPRKRLNDEQEVAEAVTFLLSNNGMSGSVLLLDAAGCQRIAPAAR